MVHGHALFLRLHPRYRSESDAPPRSFTHFHLATTFHAPLCAPNAHVAAFRQRDLSWDVLCEIWALFIYPHVSIIYYRMIIILQHPTAGGKD